ncbi:MAG: hypothetical protein M3303_05690 [Gemmatimonadota bacterium]|nr:hypothetical protein [Gemmatimonadota bacterium]
MCPFSVFRRTTVARVATVAILLTASQLEAQHPHPPPPRPDSARADTTRRPARMPGMRMPRGDTAHDEHAMHAMHASHEMSGPLGISMDRMGSGTTWIPDEVTLPSRHLTVGDWRLMLHGFLFGQYNRQSGPRGDDQFGSLNWAMLMADHALVGGRIQLRTMLSLDPATVGRCGYPLLLQSGETCHDAPLVDRQHPHDFWMEVGALYERELSSKLGLSLYAAPAGEPALSPVAFMHRPSAMDDPTAPLGHHWIDATHISFGVVTVGLFTRRLKLEGSAFNGREPDEHRWNFDPIRLDSYSGRVTFNPTPSWSFTMGYGVLEEPEPSHAGDVRRLTASALYGHGLGADGQWSAAVIYGRNAHAGESASSAALAEAEAILDRHNTVFARAELVQKSGEDLSLSGVDPERLFNVGMLGLGYIREIGRPYSGATLGLGVRGNVGFVPSVLEPAYGSRTPVGVMVFLRLRSRHLSMPPSAAPMNGSDHSHTGD